MHQRALLFSSLLAAVKAQQVGTQKAEVHPSMSWQRCTSDGSCSTVDGKVVIDSNWRWVHTVDGYTNCYTGNEWDTEICPDDETCAENCAVDGADYEGTYGAVASGNSLSLDFVTKSEGTNIGSRLYMMEDDSTYQIFKLLGQEFTFDVDVSNLPCGLNGALYFVSMDADGGMSRYPANKAGAEYGTGYCDSQCPRDLKFINGAVCVPSKDLNKKMTDFHCSRPTLKAGPALIMIRTLVLEITVLAVLRWISGRPTASPMP